MIDIKFIQEENKAIALDNSTQIGECVFENLDGTWNIIHTGVDSKYQGQGIAKKLVNCVIEEEKKYNKKLIADCSYAKKMLEKI